MKSTKKNAILALLLALSCLFAACQASQPDPTTAAAPEEAPPQLDSWDCNPLQTDPTNSPPAASETKETAPGESESQETEPAEPTGQEETVPTNSASPDMTPQFLRIRDVSEEAMELLMASYADNPDLDNDIPSFLLQDPEAYLHFQNRVNSETLFECNAFDAAFFAQCDLLIIPRITTSGSVQHSVGVEYGSETIVTVTARMPEVGTADMTNWLLLIPLEKTSAPAAAVMEGGWTPLPGGLVTE